MGVGLLKVGEVGVREREGGLGRTKEILGKGRLSVSTETLGVTGVGFIMLGAVNDLFWEGEEGGGCLKEMR